ncbi:MAG: PAS domain S-box protein, partial [Elusimicrobiales bacterium]|nr:PAS domain S-box protein [Elusimicrobiales bacterium]
DAIMLLDEKGFFDCNAATLLLFGCATKEEICSRHPGDFSPPKQPDGMDSMVYARNNIARALKEGGARFEHLHRRLDGTDFPAHVLLNKMVLNGKEVLQARVYDINERKIEDRKLQKANYDMAKRIKELNCLYGLSKLAMTPGLSLPLLFKGLIKIIPQGWQYPDITAARIIYKGEKYKTDNFKKTRWLQSEAIMVNKKAEGMLEIIYLKKKPAEAEGPFLKEERTLLVMITERLGEIISRILEHEQLEAAYQQLAASEQQEKAVNQQLMASEQEIRALEKIWREANNSLEDILVIIDTDRNIVKINAAGLKLIGKKEKDIIGKKCYEVFYGTICLIESCSLKKFMKNGEEGKTDIYVKDLGKHFSIKCSPIFNDKGEITGFIDLIMDITERKLEEEKLLKSEEKYRLIADNSIDVIWKLDLKMAFTYASPS